MKRSCPEGGEGQPVQRPKLSTDINRPFSIPGHLPKTTTYRNYILDQRHRHPRDFRVLFDDGGDGSKHDYYVDWDGTGNFEKGGNTSVTSLYSHFFAKFDAEKIVTNLSESSRKKKIYRGKTNEEIKAMWAANGKEAREAGHELHEFIDHFLNGLKTKEDALDHPREMEIYQFMQAHFDMVKSGLESYRSEWFTKTDKEHRVPGAIDMLYVNKAMMERIEKSNEDNDTLHLVIADWKRTKEIKTFSREYGMYPLQHVKNCNYEHYSLQLNIYKYILETFYKDARWNGKTYKKIKVDQMYIFVFHPNNKVTTAGKVYQMHLCRHYQQEVKNIFLIQKESEARKARGEPALYPINKNGSEAETREFIYANE